MKLIKIFIAFVGISLFVGVGSAFNGQPIQENLADNIVQQEVVETKETVENNEIDEKIVESEVKQESNLVVSGENKTDNSFSESKKKTTSSGSDKSVKESQKNETSKSQETNSTNEQANSKSNDQLNKQNQEIVDNSKNNSNTQPKINDSDIMNSITKGRTEFSDESECYSRRLYIQNKEMDSILDWNEQPPDDMKQPIINNSICYPIVKGGQEFWYLHFKTTEGNKDDELKQLYK